MMKFKVKWKELNLEIILIHLKKENIFNFQIQKINQDNKQLYVIKKI